MPDSTSSKLNEILQEVTEHHHAASTRIQAYYENPEQSEFDTAPHDQQLLQAAHYIEFALLELNVPERYRDVNVPEQFQYATQLERSVDWRKRHRWVKQRIEDVLYGVAIELIVSAAHLKIDTKEYLSKLIDENRTPPIWRSKERLLEDLETDIAPDSVDEIESVLKLAKRKRDNIAHFGFHYQGAHYYPALFVDVSGFLIERYADTDDIPELKTMTAYRDEYDRRRTDAESYPEVSVGIGHGR